MRAPAHIDPAVLAAHAEFGGDLEDMQRRYESATADDVTNALQAALDAAGSYAELSRRVGISDEYARQACRGTRPVRGALLAFLGFKKVTSYQRLPGRH
jgi:hypothetical protein